MDSPRDNLDRPMRDLRISVTDRCNLRCPYCMPAEVFGDRYEFLPRAEILTFEEITRLARSFVATGVRKIRITGGEPLLRANLPDLVERLSKIEDVEDLTLTTNGLLLAQHAQALAKAGLGRVTVSLDSLDAGVFKDMSGRAHDPQAVLAGIAAAEAAGLGPIKVNCVVRRGVNDGTVLQLAEHFRGTPHVLRFIEFMDVGTLNAWDLSEVVPAKELLEQIASRWPLAPVDPAYSGEVARRYAYTDGAGEIGMIASVTAPFCGDCTRARLSTKGELVTCLFATGGVDLRAPLRSGASDEELAQIVATTWSGRTDRYSEDRSDRTTDLPRIEMFRIGG